MLTSDFIVDTLTRYRRAWFDLDGRGGVYLRFGYRAGFEPLPLTSLDIASIETHEGHRRQGVFTHAVELVERAAREANREVVYCECIHNPIVVEALARRGYTVRGESPEWTAYKVLPVVPSTTKE